MTGKPHGRHGEYCACSRWGVSIVLGCPNPARPLNVISVENGRDANGPVSKTEVFVTEK